MNYNTDILCYDEDSLYCDFQKGVSLTVLYRSHPFIKKLQVSDEIKPVSVMYEYAYMVNGNHCVLAYSNLGTKKEDCSACPPPTDRVLSPDRKMFLKSKKFLKSFPDRPTDRPTDRDFA